VSYEIEANYNQQWLLPPSLEDLLPAGHPARLVREFVDAVDLKGLGFQTRTVELGRPSYGASLLTKVFLYGYMNRVRSCRGLERACMNDMGLLWLTGMNYPDHTTLWRFWNDNRPGMRKLFRQLLQIAASANLVGMVMHAVDGTKIFSQASETAAWHRSNLEEKLKKLDQAIDDIMRQTEQAEGSNGGTHQLPEPLQQRQQLRQMIQTQLQQLEEKDRDHLQPKDEDARVMKCGSRMKFAYNAQAVVDQDSKLIVAADVVTDESDNYQLVSMLEQVEQNVGRVAEQSAADGGYFATTELATAEDKKYSVLVNLPESVQGKDKPYHASRFVYDDRNDHCICPRGEVLSFDSIKPRDKARPYEVRVYRCQSYESCPVRWQCSSSKTGRTVQIHPNHDALVRQREKLKDDAMRAMLKQRGATVEPVFGWAKEAMGFRRWTFRGRDRVKTQWLLLCTAMNLLRLYKHWIEGKLVFA
jgi:transposase